MTDHSTPPTPPTQEPDKAEREGLLARIIQLRTARRAKSDPQTDPQAEAQTRITALTAYWAGLCRDDPIPRRADLDPRAISALLPDMVLLEKIAPGMARMRVTGTRVCTRMGMNLRGMPLSVLFGVEDRAALCGHLDRLFEEGVTLDLRIEAPEAFGRAALPARLSLLPLRDGMGEVTRAVGLFLPHGGTDAKLRRFRILHATAGAPLLPAPQPAPAPAEVQSEPPAAAKTTTEMGLQPAAPRAKRATRPPRSVPHLRLVHSV